MKNFLIPLVFWLLAGVFGLIVTTFFVSAVGGS